MAEPIRLLTFPKPKYREQIVALVNDIGMNLALFDACEIFMEDNSMSERNRVQEEARKFAEKFVAQMNAAS